MKVTSSRLVVSIQASTISFPYIFTRWYHVVCLHFLELLEGILESKDGDRGGCREAEEKLEAVFKMLPLGGVPFDADLIHNNLLVLEG